jgi:hypothetical protein
MVLLCLVGCSEPAHEALLVQRQIDSDCQLERVVPGQGEPRVLGVVPGACGAQILFAPDGSRMLLASFPKSFELDLASGEVRELPSLFVDTSPALPDPALHLDGQGAVLWEVVLGEGAAEHDSEGWPSWRAYRYQLHALRDGAWVVEAESVEPEGSARADARAQVEARFSSEVALPPRNRQPRGQPASAELDRALDEASGAPAELWRVEGEVAQPVRKNRAEWPVLLRVGGRWQALPVRSGEWSELEVGRQWLIVREGRAKGHVYALSTGEEVWTGPATVSLWPLQVPIP